MASTIVLRLFKLRNVLLRLFMPRNCVLSLFMVRNIVLSLILSRNVLLILFLVRNNVLGFVYGKKFCVKELMAEYLTVLVNIKPVLGKNWTSHLSALPVL